MHGQNTMATDMGHAYIHIHMLLQWLGTWDLGPGTYIDMLMQWLGTWNMGPTINMPLHRDNVHGQTRIHE